MTLSQDAKEVSRGRDRVKGGVGVRGVGVGVGGGADHAVFIFSCQGYLHASSDTREIPLPLGN